MIIKTLIQKYNTSSIKFKLFGIIIFHTIILISSYCYVILTEQNKSIQTYEITNLQVSAKLLTTVAGNMKTMEEVSKFPILRESANQYTALYNLLNSDINPSKHYEYQTLFLNKSKAFLDIHPYIDSIFIYNAKGFGNYVARENSYDMPCFLQDTNTPWYQKTLSQKGGITAIYPTEFISSGVAAKNENLIGISRSIMNMESFESIGVIVVGMRSQTVDRQFDKVRQFPSQDYGIYYKGQLIAGSLTGDSSAHSYAKRVIDKHSETNYLKTPGTHYMYSAYAYDKNYSIIIRTDMAAINQGVVYYRTFFYILTVLLILVTISTIYSITSGVLQPIQSLIFACNKLENQDFTINLNRPVSRELSKLFYSFKNMSKRIESLIYEVLLKDITKKDLELQLLRTQINPHYLYNTLECMRMIAYVHDEYDIAEIANLLGRNLQYGLRNTNTEVSVYEETKSVNEYVRLISYHYGDNINVHMELADEILQCKTIKMILQPIVENAVMHGISGKSEEICICIMGYKIHKTLTFVVTDDGIGMSEDTLLQLRKSLEETEEICGIGLKNVHRRIKLYYGEQYGITVQSVLGKGTTVKIELPIKYSIDNAH